MPTVTFPSGKQGAQNVTFTDGRPIVVVGANSTGKSRLCFWLTRRSSEGGYRVAAQRELAFPQPRRRETIEHAEATVLAGHEGADTDPNQPMTDFGALLLLLFSDEAKRNRDYARPSVTAVPGSVAPKCKLDTLKEIWASILPQRTLIIGADTIDAAKGSQQPYSAKMMSDGERGVFYLIGKCLCAPQGSVIVVDEPEIHLHQAIQAQLWDRIEDTRSDCTFVYITHDLEFAASRSYAHKIWMRSYDNDGWEWEEIQSNPAFPDAMLFAILGSRRPILFVEGDESSYDKAIYSALFPNELVFPRQGCQKVLEATKAMRGLETLHYLTVRGIVDRDRRGEAEIKALKDAGMLVANVAEVENLLCLPEAIIAVATALKHDDVPVKARNAQVKVLEELRNLLDQQVTARALAEIQFHLNGFGPKPDNPSGLEAALAQHVSTIDEKGKLNRCRELFQQILDRRDYRDALRFFNCKGILPIVASSLGIKPDVYSRMVLANVKSEPEGAVSTAMRAEIGP